MYQNIKLSRSLLSEVDHNNDFTFVLCFHFALMSTKTSFYRVRKSIALTEVPKNGTMSENK